MKERSKIHENAFKTVTVRNVELTAPYIAQWCIRYVGRGN